MEIEIGKSYNEDEIRDAIERDRGNSIFICDLCKSSKNAFFTYGGTFSIEGNKELIVKDIIENYVYTSNNYGDLNMPNVMKKIYILEEHKKG